MKTIFSRNEKKYIISQAQSDKLKLRLTEFMKPDKYSTYWVQNLFYDTENWDMIHTSMEKPYYKEKMRLRCYGSILETDRVFLELKKKYSGTVYKRRVPLSPSDVIAMPIEEILLKNNSQISKELKYHIQRTGVAKKFYLSYYRNAFVCLNNSDLRLTIDTNIRYRLNNLNFVQSINYGTALDSNMFLLEIKTASNIPLWLTNLLGELGIYSTPFSKYAACFTHWKKQEKLETLVIESA